MTGSLQDHYYYRIITTTRLLQDHYYYRIITTTGSLQDHYHYKKPSENLQRTFRKPAKNLQRTLRGPSENQTGDWYAARCHRTDSDSETRVTQCSYSGNNFWQLTVCCENLFPRKLHSTLPKTEPCCYVYWESSGNVVGWRRMKLPELVVSHDTD